MSSMHEHQRKHSQPATQTWKERKRAKENVITAANIMPSEEELLSITTSIHHLDHQNMREFEYALTHWQDFYAEQIKKMLVPHVKALASRKLFSPNSPPTAEEITATEQLKIQWVEQLLQSTSLYYIYNQGTPEPTFMSEEHIYVERGSDEYHRDMQMPLDRITRTLEAIDGIIEHKIEAAKAAGKVLPTAQQGAGFGSR